MLLSGCSAVTPNDVSAAQKPPESSASAESPDDVIASEEPQDSSASAGSQKTEPTPGMQPISFDGEFHYVNPEDCPDGLQAFMNQLSITAPYIEMPGSEPRDYGDVCLTR